MNKQRGWGQMTAARRDYEARQNLTNSTNPGHANCRIYVKGEEAYSNLPGSIVRQIKNR